MILKFLSVGPDFYKEDRFPAYHFIQLGKADNYVNKMAKIRKELPAYEEKDVHYRRAIGMRIVLQGMEAAFKKGFRTYGGQKIFLSVMIAPAKSTPISARNFLTTKIKLIEKGTIRSSPPPQARICQFRGHEGDVCAACTIEKGDKIKRSNVEDKIPDPYEDDD